MRRVLIATFLVTTIPAAAEVIKVELAPGTVVEKKLTVAPSKFLELCAKLRRGQTVAWRFQADASLDFNVHYHVGKEVTYPEQRAGVRDSAGLLTIVADQDYCWMWTNRTASSIVVDASMSAK